MSPSIAPHFSLAALEQPRAGGPRRHRPRRQKSYETLDTVMEQSFDAQLDDLKMAGATVRVVTIKEAAQFEVATNYRTGAQST